MSVLRYATRLLRWSRVLPYARQVEDDNSSAQGVFQLNIGGRKGSTTKTWPFDSIVVSTRMATPQEIEDGWIKDEVIKITSIHGGKMTIERRCLG